MSADGQKAKTFKCGTCDHFNRGCVAPVPFWAEPHGRPRIYSEDTGCEVHSQLVAALDTPAPALMAELVEALAPLYDIAKDRAADVPEWKDSDTVVAYLSIGSLRRAAAVLAKIGGA